MNAVYESRNGKYGLWPSNDGQASYVTRRSAHAATEESRHHVHRAIPVWFVINLFTGVPIQNNYTPDFPTFNFQPHVQSAQATFNLHAAAQLHALPLTIPIASLASEAKQKQRTCIVTITESNNQAILTNRERAANQGGRQTPKGRRFGLIFKAKMS